MTSTRSTIHDDGRTLALAGGGRFNRFWLRDVCPSLPTKESGLRTFSVASLPADLTMTDVDDDGGTVVVHWSDGHISTFDADTVRRIADEAAEHRGAPIPARTFGADHKPPRFPAASLVAGSGVHHDLLDAVAIDGFALVTDLPDDDGATEVLASLLGRIRETDYGRVFDIVTEPEAWTLSQSNKGQDAHSDDPFRYTPSGISILHCRRAAAGTGGRSIVVDGFRVAEDLRSEDPAAFDLLTTVAIPYIRRRTEAVDQGDDVDMIAHAPVLSVVDGELMGVRFHERSTGVFDLPGDLVDDYYLAFRAFAEKVREPAYQFDHRLADGEAIVFDNQRVLHGRTGYETDIGGRRHIRLCTVDRDQVHSRLRRLKDVHGRPGRASRMRSGTMSS